MTFCVLYAKIGILFDRELKPLAHIRDNYEKIVLTGDRLTVGNYSGIQVKNLSDWLLGI